MRKTLTFLPNFLTILRIILCPLALFLLFHNKIAIAIALFFLSSFTDYLDGYLARKLKCVSRLGSLLDPLADKIILLSFFISLMFMGISPAWFTGLILSVNLLQIIGFLALNLPTNTETKVAFTTLKIGKINTFLQYVWIACLIGIQLFQIPYSSFTVSFRWLGHGSLALLQIATFIQYFTHFRIYLSQDFKAVYQS